MRYQPGGVLFVSMNPGAGPDGGFGPDDQRQYETLQHLREAGEHNAESAFDELTRVLAEIMPRWRIQKNFVAPVLRAAGLDFDEAAYMNLLKWRTKSSSGLARMYSVSWSDHTERQINVLAPGRVIAIGTDAGRAFRKHCHEPVLFDFIPRVIVNNVGPAGRGALGRIASSFQPSVK